MSKAKKATKKATNKAAKKATTCNGGCAIPANATAPDGRKIQ